MTGLPSTAICLFAKPALPGEVKTRLAQSLGDQSAAAVAQAMFRDNWDMVNQVTDAEAVIASTDRDLSTLLESSGDVKVWLQGPGDLGSRMEHIFKFGLETYDKVIAIGSDIPGMTVDDYDAAIAALDEHDAVIGPTEDGGYYMIGLRHCKEGLLADLPWSESITYEATMKRLAQHGYSVSILDRWYDIDTIQDLRHLYSDIAAGRVWMPQTQQLLPQLEDLLHEA